MNLSEQIKDDIALLELMIEDARHIPEVYQPTNYWSYYQQNIIDHIRDKGLQNIRSSDNEFLSSFGARDLHPIKAPVTSIASLSESEQTIKKFLEYLILTADHPEVPLLPYDLSLNDLSETAFRFSDTYGRVCGGKPLTDIGASLAGGPEYYFYINDKPYTYSFLCHYWRYCFCAKFIDFNEVDTIVELGMGTGKQAEVIKKLHPHITYYLLDLPPQAYLTTQFLKAIFGDLVNDYSVHRQNDSIVAEEGSINVLCNWQIDSLKINSKTLFWNAASFGEMEPNVVKNYLDIASKWSTYIYLHQCMRGKEKGNEGEGGVLEQTTFEHYQNSLAASYTLLSKELAYNPLKRIDDSGGYEEVLFIHNE